MSHMNVLGLTIIVIPVMSAIQDGRQHGYQRSPLPEPDFFSDAPFSLTSPRVTKFEVKI